MITDQKKYYSSLKNSLLEFFHNDKKVKVFIFGSSAKNDHFGDIDIGIMGDISDKKIREIIKAYNEN